MKSENVIGGTGAKRLLPWLRNTNKSDYIIVVSDPRQKSIEFRNTIKSLSLELPKDIFNKIVFINADMPSENRKALKKIQLGDDSSIRLFSDEKREWMQTYTALGENRWSMTLFILAEGRVQRLVREFSQISCSTVIQNASSATEKRRL
ncbi:MAG: CO dehydrogenase nickel-insertion accessory protein CooC1 [Bacillariaceae sp.]|jgi:CO dehydrogenase nickel-insertion accessory protein CooC1